MIGPVVLLWLASLVAPVPGGEIRAAHRGDARADLIAVDRSPDLQLQRPTPRPRSSETDVDFDATGEAIETESDEESNGSGPAGLTPHANRSLHRTDGRSASVKARAVPPGPSRRLITRLRF